MYDLLPVLILTFWISDHVDVRSVRCFLCMSTKEDKSELCRIKQPLCLFGDGFVGSRGELDVPVDSHTMPNNTMQISEFMRCT